MIVTSIYEHDDNSLTFVDCYTIEERKMIAGSYSLTVVFV